MKEQNPRERTKQHRDNQPIRCRVQNTGDQDVQRAHEYGKNIKEEMKVTLSEIKKNLQRNNLRGGSQDSNQ